MTGPTELGEQRREWTAWGEEGEWPIAVRMAMNSNN